MIGNLGFFELTLFSIIALIVLGPDKLPVAARTLGRWYGMFRRASQRLQTEITNELQLLETQQMLKKELDEIRQSEARIKAQMNALERSLDRTQTQQQNTTKKPASQRATQS
ncbi:Sec-independent protein translocase protein TatB [Moraxella catarrhalis]|uniref:Sec-independent protein translocase protein TatB n=1 Tax=Moraxella catarrhalis TaxID=480 RepID=UPI0007F490F0|nr:Sec-independent protein translocase protein TatB [Moraxella catarrhalis]OAV38226.1 Twin-arginine translocation protein TatB [Moraxella catarrhalis]